MKECGIYTITNRKNGRLILGSSADILKRWSNYKRLLQQNKYGNKELQEDFNEFGLENFEWCIQENCDKKDLLNFEKQYIKFYRDLGVNLYNKNRVIKTEVTKKKKSDKFSLAQRGSLNGMNTKLDEDMVIEIKEMLRDGTKQSIIAQKFDISSSFVSAINTGKRWKHIDVNTKKIETVGAESI